jgi:hypothetical protein
MSERYYHHEGGFLKQKHIMFLQEAAKLMNLGWKPIAARPNDELTVHLITACDLGMKPQEAVDDFAETIGESDEFVVTKKD